VVRSTELTRRLGDRGAYGVIQCFHTLVLRAAAPFTLRESEWNITEVARRLGLARSHVYNLIRAFELGRAQPDSL
jgi:transcriptional regulator of acetoin/glycerol metabolism